MFSWVGSAIITCLTCLILGHWCEAFGCDVVMADWDGDHSNINSLLVSQKAVLSSRELPSQSTERRTNHRVRLTVIVLRRLIYLGLAAFSRAQRTLRRGIHESQIGLVQFTSNNLYCVSCLSSFLICHYAIHRPLACAPQGDWHITCHPYG